MSPDDPRHGSYAGAVAHWLDGSTACAPCRAAGTRYHKRRRLQLLSGASRRVPAVGYRRRVQALQAIGHAIPAISTASGVPVPTLRNLIYRESVEINVDTARKIAEAYDALRDLPQFGHYPDRDRGQAKKKGWSEPRAWFDIDDPAERPDPGHQTYRPHDEVDQVVVERILAGDWTLAPAATKAERVAVVAAWTGGANELERLTGWNVPRYIERPAA